MNTKNKGFTLLEVSIVLVVIGFIVGVVLFGQDIINQARLRSIITQLERYNAATNVFRDRYNSLPGDIPNVAKNSSFFSTPGLLNTIGGNGDNYVGALQELSNFFHHLGVLGLTDFVGTGVAAPVGPVGVAYPFLKNSNKAGFRVHTALRANATVGATEGMFFNAYYLGITNTLSDYENVFTAREAYNIDTKIDDGMPVTGTVQALSGADLFILPLTENTPSRSVTASATPSCIEGPTPATTYTIFDVYKISGNTIQCQLRIKTGF